jgi:hypothetical protein
MPGACADGDHAEVEPFVHESLRNHRYTGRTVSPGRAVGHHTKGVTLMRFRVVAAVAIGVVGATALLAGTAVAGTSASAKVVAFKGSYAGRAIVRTTGSDSANLSATGKGTGTLLGASALVGTGVGLQSDPCPVFSGKGTLTATKGGAKIYFTVAPGATSCAGATESDPNALKGTAKVTGGTGAFKKARGTLKLGGTYSRATGKYAMTLAGPLTV